jgi:hypothetical protein
MRYLEIDRSSHSGVESLNLLLEQFMTISEMIPDDVDPAVDFELYSLERLCRSAGQTIESYLLEMGHATGSRLASERACVDR